MLNPTLKKILDNRQVETNSGELKPLHSAIGADEGLFLQEIIAKIHPSNSIEIGCAYGISSLYICDALSQFGAGARHTILDPFQTAQWESIGILNIERAGFAKMVRFIPEFSHRGLPKLGADDEKFQFAFIDGQHTFDYVFVDFFYIDQMLDVGGVIVFDDLGYSSIRKVCRYILTNLPYEAIGPKLGIGNRKPSWKRRLAQKVAPALPRGLINAEFRLPDEEIGLPVARFVAIRKKAKNEVFDGKNGTRHWTFHNDF